MPLEEDTRHADRNEEALERSKSQLRPTVRSLLGEILEMDAKELIALRNMLKAIAEERAARAERKKDGIKETIRLVIVSGLGGAATWLASHLYSGGGK